MISLETNRLRRALKKRDWEMIKISAEGVFYEVQGKINPVRDSVVSLMLSSCARQRVKHGVAPYMFWDYNSYVTLIAESVRNFAKERSGTLLQWPGRFEQFAEDEDWLKWNFDAETDLLNKWADILSIHDSDLMHEPYYKPFWDYMGKWKSVPASWDEKGEPTSFRIVFAGESEEVAALRKDVKQHEDAILALQQDILMELAENFRYMWD